MADEQKTFYITYNHDISPDKVNSLIGLISNLMANGMTTLYLLLSSPGGDVNAGVTLYNFLKSLPIEVITHNMGSIDSIATVVFLGGKTRYGCPHSTFMFHGVKLFLNTNMTLPQLNEIVDYMVKDQEKISGIVCSETKLTKTKLSRLFREGETQNSLFAIKNGIVEKITLPQIPQNANLITVEFNNQPS